MLSPSQIKQLETLLARQPPFDSLGSSELQQVLADAKELAVTAGETVLVEDGLPATGLYVICSGSIEILHEGELIQVLEPGECFGHPSLLTGMAPAFTVRAHEDAECLVLPKATALRVLGRPEGAGYVAATLRQRLTRAGHTVHGLLDVGTTPVSALVRPPAFCEPDIALREAARRLGEEGVSALLVRLGDDQLGIVTDADVRAYVAGENGSIEAPVRAIARSPVPTVAISQLAVEATVDMLSAGTEHVAVVDDGRVTGLLSATDLLGLDARSPIALRHTINGAPDQEVLIRAVSHLPRLFMLLARAGVPPRDLGRVLSLQNDAVTARLIDFAIARHGPAPLPWAWLTLGSAARREFTLASDQDNAFAYATPAPDEEDSVDAYFAQLATEVNDGLVRCGFSADHNGVLAGNRLWRMSKTAWLRTFDACLREPDESHLIRATVAFDFRHSVGGLAITASLGERIRAAREHPQFMRLVARSAIGFEVPLGFRGQLTVEKHGPEAGRLDLKRGAIIPIVNLVRFHALANGVTISPTLDRIDAVASAGGIEPGVAEALREAFEVITRLRFGRHVACIAAGEPPDNLLDPGALAPVARSDLREALHSVRRAQKHLAVWAPQGL